MGVACVVAMMFITTADVVARYVFNRPTMWADEMASYLLIAIVFLGLAQNLRTDAHIRIDALTSLLSLRTRAVLEVVTHFEERYEEFQLAEAMLEHDEYFALWRSHHIKMVERMVGAKRGTGGSEGVGYLKTTLDKKFFPELWEARTYLDSEHGRGGCPFAGK